MMNKLKWMLLIGLVFLLQTQFCFIKDFSNLTVILVYYFGLKSHQRGTGSKAELGSVAFGVLVGLMEDVMSGAIIGPGILSKGLLGLMTPVVFTDMVFQWTPLFGAVIVVIFTLFDGLVLIGSRVVFTEIHVTAATFLQVICVQSLFNMPFGILLRP